MSVNFHKSKKIGKYTRLNFGKKSFGTSIGVKGARVSINSKRGIGINLGIPGTGINFRKTFNGKGIAAVISLFFYISLMIIWIPLKWIIVLTWYICKYFFFLVITVFKKIYEWIRTLIQKNKNTDIEQTIQTRKKVYIMGIFSKLFKNDDYDSRAKLYPLDTLEQINSIPVPTKTFKYKCDFTQSIEYVLQRKATEYKKAGNMDLAIACLKKSNEIMPFAPMMYSAKDYERLEKYLKIAGRFDEAREEHANTNTTDSSASKCNTNKIMSDYIEVQRGECICENCAKYHDRIYSCNAKDGYPDSAIFYKYYENKLCSCFLPVYPVFKNISEPMISDKKNPIKYSNRPFSDDRTNKEKQTYQLHFEKALSETKDRADYDWICQHLPDVAPKSFGGYRNMKNHNSDNYQKLISLAEKNGYSI